MRKPLLAAAALAGNLTLLALGGLPVEPSHASLLSAGNLALALASSLALLWRPLPAFAIAVAATSLMDPGPGLPVAPALAVYLLAESGWTRRRAAAVAAGFAVYLVSAGLARDGFPASEMFHGALAVAAAWFAGERTRLRRERELRTRREAVLEERTRIARDLHDSAGHAINVIGVLAGAARLRDDPEKSRTALGKIEELARATAGELDQILHVLRDTAPPGLASLDTLVARSGLEVTVQAPHAPLPLSGTVDQAAYRILQEALTNAARHGTGRAEVRVSFNDGRVELTITNPVRGHASGRTGHGLIGMQERATLLGGTLEAGRVDGDFRVHAALPFS